MWYYYYIRQTLGARTHSELGHAQREECRVLASHPTSIWSLAWALLELGPFDTAITLEKHLKLSNFRS